MTPQEERANAEENGKEASFTDTSETSGFFTEDSTGQSDEAPDTPEEEAGEHRVAALEAEVAALKDQYLRKAAEFENFRKRMNREKQDAIEFANQSLLLDLIPILDDFERALQSASAHGDTPSSESHAEFTSFYEGVALIEKRLSSQLENKWALKRFDAAGEPFDPNRHEALMMEKSSDVQEPEVREVFMRGYTLRDRVVRSAKVKVIMPDVSIEPVEDD